MIVIHRGRRPSIHPDAYVAPSATLVGDVTIAAGARVLHQAVLTAEDGSVHVGERSVVMEHALVRGREKHPARIGSSVMIGPHTHVNGSTIEDAAFLATGAAVFPGSRIGAGAEVRIHAVVHVNTVIGPGVVVPIGWVAVGDPARILPPERHEEIWSVQRELDFPGTVFGASRDLPMAELMRQQSAYYGAHADDVVVPDDEARAAPRRPR